MGVGKKLCAAVTQKAEEEGVVVGLEASAMGEWLYRSVGFELLKRFDTGPWYVISWESYSRAGICTYIRGGFSKAHIY